MFKRQPCGVWNVHRSCGPPWKKKLSTLFWAPPNMTADDGADLCSALPADAELSAAASSLDGPGAMTASDVAAIGGAAAADGPPDVHDALVKSEAAACSAVGDDVVPAPPPKRSAKRVTPSARGCSRKKMAASTGLPPQAPAPPLLSDPIHSVIGSPDLPGAVATR
jgi:hypothetical protein